MNPDLLVTIQSQLLQIWGEQNFISSLKKLVQLVHSLDSLKGVSYVDLKAKKKTSVTKFSKFKNVCESALKKGAAVQHSNFTDAALLEIADLAFYFHFTAGYLLFEFNDKPKNLEIVEFCCLQTGAVIHWQRKSSEAEKLVYRDDLTGVFSYRYLDIALDQELKRYLRFATPFSVIFFDLDGFKQVNDRFGHLVGSEILKQVGNVTLSSVRDIDVVIRYGGDEFVVLLIGTTQSGAKLVAERLRAQIEFTQFKIDIDRTVQLTASLGIASCPIHTQTKEQLIHLADHAMYESKNSGKNKISVAVKSPKGVLQDAIQATERK